MIAVLLAAKKIHVVLKPTDSNAPPYGVGIAKIKELTGCEAVPKATTGLQVTEPFVVELKGTPDTLTLLQKNDFDAKFVEE